jgi:hypothetical protein
MGFLQLLEAASMPVIQILLISAFPLSWLLSISIIFLHQILGNP